MQFEMQNRIHIVRNASRALIMLGCIAFCTHATALTLPQWLTDLPKKAVAAIPSVKILSKEKKEEPTEKAEKTPEPVIIPFKGYLPEIGVLPFRTEEAPTHFNRARLIALPTEAMEEPMKKEMENQESLQDLMNSLIEEEMNEDKMKKEEMMGPEPPTETETKTEPEATEPEAEEASDSAGAYTDFVNPDEILLYFEKQTLNDNPNSQSTIGFPITVPNQSAPQTPVKPSEATFEQK